MSKNFNQKMTQSEAKEILKEQMQKALGSFDATADMSSPQTKKLRRWLIKKADIHPKLVCKAMKYLLEQQYIIELLQEHDIFPETPKVIALLHDLGRLREVDAQKEEIILMEKHHAYTHSEVSYGILKEMGVHDNDILIPIRYHNQNFLEKQSDVQMFTKQEQDRLKVLWMLIVDADCLGNMAYQSRCGVRGTVEEISGKYHHEAFISEKIKNLILEGQADGIRLRHYETTYAEVLVCYLSLCCSFKFEASKSVFKKYYLQPIYKILLEELTTSPATCEQRKKAVDTAKDIYDFITS